MVALFDTCGEVIKEKDEERIVRKAEQVMDSLMRP